MLTLTASRGLTGEHPVTALDALQALPAEQDVAADSSAEAPWKTTCSDVTEIATLLAA